VILKLCLIFILTTTLAFGQAPNITYSSGTVAVTPGMPVSLTPVNTGGTVPANQYFQVSTFAGSNSGLAGTAGYVNGTGTAALFNNPQDMAFDASNNLYLADAGNNAIRMITPAGVVTTFAGSLTGVAGFANGTGTSALFNSPVGLTFDAYGNLLVADYNNAAIREISPAGVVTTFYQGTPGKFAPKRICFDNLAFLWVTMDGGPLIAEIPPNGVLGTYFAAYLSQTNPIGIGVDALGFLYTADAERNEIFKYNIIDVLAENIIAGDSSATTFQLNGVGNAATFTNPSGMQVMPDGTVYVADLKNNDIRKISPGDTVSLFAGYVPLNGSGFPTQQPGYVDGPLAGAQFNQPCDVRADNNGNLYVSEWGAGGNRIRKITHTGYALTGIPLPAGLTFDMATGIISGIPITAITAAQTDTITAINAGGSSIAIITLTPGVPLTAPNISYASAAITAGVPVALAPTNTGGAVPATAYGTVTTLAGGVSGNIPGTGANAELNFPQSMVTDAAGNLYVAAANNAAVEKITPEGVVSDFAGNVDEFTGFQDGTGKLAYFNYPDGIAIDASGNFFVADYKNNAIRKVTPGAVVTTFYTATTPFGPGGMRFDNSGNLIVSAQDANQVWKITATGVASVVAGTTVAGYVNGAAGAAQFNNPSDIQVDIAGNIYVADYQNNAIRMITPAGQVSTIAGSNISGNSPAYANGKGTAARFNNPAGIIRASGGVTYVADTYNNDIRRIMPDGTVGLVAGSTTQGNGVADGVGTAAGFYAPVYMFTDGAGTGYISELAGGRIRKIVLTGYSLTGTLPAGLSFDPATGIISGTPTGPVVSQVDTITAYNSAGYSTTIITIPPSAIATLSNLVPGSGTLSPVFASGTTSYTAAVSNSTTSITVIPTSTDGTSTITVNSTPVTSGSPSNAIPLSIGANTITIVVTAQDGVTKDTYTIAVTRSLPGIATLSKLTISSGALTPAFSAGTTSYTDVAHSVTSIAVRAITTDPLATETINGTAVPEGTVSFYIPLNVGVNNISVVVTAQDGVTQDTYTIAVTRLPGVATLSKLTISSGALTPAFSGGTTSYTDVAHSVTSIAFRAITTDPLATETINGTAVPEGTVSFYIPLNVGVNNISVVVTAQDGVTQDTYTIAVTRLPGIATLSKLTISSGTLTPAFATPKINYNDNVANTVDSLAFRAITTDLLATETINGTAVPEGTVSPYFPLNVGPNTITIIVTAEDGVTTETYTIAVTRVAAPVADAVYQPISVEIATGSPQLANDGIVVHMGVSPNGDGIDDFLEIDNISNYPDNKLIIINRNGTLVYETKGYDNVSRVFDGHSNKSGQMQLPGTYFYSLDYAVNGIIKHKTGFLVLKY
jgi:gliding motility-associated-like protein